MLQRARQDQEHQKSLEWAMQLLDRAIAQVEDERRAETLRDLLKDARLELARVEE